MLHELLYPSYGGRVLEEQLVINEVMITSTSIQPGAQSLTLLRYDDPGGSRRYVLTAKDRPVAAIQVMESQTLIIIANIYVVPDLRRKGLATMLLERSLQDFPGAMISQHLTPDGEAFFRGVRSKAISFRRKRS